MVYIAQHCITFLTSLGLCANDVHKINNLMIWLLFIVIVFIIIIIILIIIIMIMTLIVVVVVIAVVVVVINLIGVDLHSFCFLFSIEKISR